MTIAARDSEDTALAAAQGAASDVVQVSRVSRFFSSRGGRFVGQVAIVAAILSIWQFGSGRFLPHVWVSSPTLVIAKLYGWFANGSIWVHLAATLTSAAIGY